ncbi:class 1 fructose-bisphosphatase [Methyloradius palustris]|uniref:Fructose-1,6-bisphosphatase class 1 n=1 Tax=Methyloradius palustris TaxID=2778876 RepID=A0A8D5G735_9PROT|nr:class 1 fructose-bisphosphatase [Methyloradius palustris]BCM24367.1 fructose-1,6-bisphosphatase class 1 [Methyloradius palustris]
MPATSLSEYLIEKQKKLAHLNDGLVSVLVDLAEACKKTAHAVNQGALTHSLESLDSINVQGEKQQALDVISNDIFLAFADQNKHVAGLVSEELPDVYFPHHLQSDADQFPAQRYLLAFDPLDGSSNVSLNISVGSIFSVLPCPDAVQQPQAQAFLQAGKHQVCAGYAMYGFSTMLVITLGDGVDCFTLDETTDEFVLTSPEMKIPQDANEFAINMSHQRFWEPAMQRYVGECLQGVEGVRKKDFNMRWVASMVAEVHRILVRGGVFMYPTDSKIKKQGGKLRLLYEANPMSFIVEQAGGASSTAYERILDIIPDHIHQRVGVVLGAKHEVELVNAYHNR